ncbi:class II fructose-bisphosphate aldolase [candidate division KSB1 bacterium]|nr:class II fructose-bisphosphate aldolase [candidate division KSB1 bacterium]
MPLVPYNELLKAARHGEYAVGAFNIFGLEFLPAILEVAEEEKSPVIMQINPVHFYLSDLPEYLSYVKSQIAKTRIPVGLNLDHGKNRDIILKGIRDGFPSVMFDGSQYPYAENKTKTREIVEICKPIGITVEAELGTLNDEGLELTKDNQNLLFTDPDKAAEFVNETGIDGLAVAIGNAHGFYKGEPKLDFKRLKKIRDKVPVPLVLHGGSGIAVADFKKAVSLGINKINIYTEMSASASMMMKTLLNAQEKPADFPASLYKVRLAVKEVVREKITIFGSCGKA